MTSENKPEIDSIDSHIKRLSSISAGLHLNSITITVLTACNIMFSIFLFSSAQIFLNFRLSDTIFFVLLPQAFIFLMLLFVLYSFDRKRKRGDIILQEVSDELFWDTRKSKNTPYHPTGEATENSTPLDIRILLREFSLNETLPFVPKEAGAAVYLSVNLSLLLTSFAFFGVYVFRA